MFFCAAECREYGQLIYEKILVNNPVLNEPPIEKVVSKCNHEVVQLIVGKQISHPEFNPFLRKLNLF